MVNLQNIELYQILVGENRSYKNGDGSGSGRVRIFPVIGSAVMCLGADLRRSISAAIRTVQPRQASGNPRTQS